MHNRVGPGLREESYQKGLEVRLAEKGLPFVAKPHTRRESIHRGEIADVFEPDFVVADRSILELKAQREGLNHVNFTQMLNYVKCWGLSLGLLANFAEAQAVIERVPYEPRQVTAIEDYEFIKPSLTPSVREELLIVPDSPAARSILVQNEERLASCSAVIVAVDDDAEIILAFHFTAARKPAPKPSARMTRRLFSPPMASRR